MIGHRSYQDLANMIPDEQNLEIIETHAITLFWSPDGVHDVYGAHLSLVLDEYGHNGESHDVFGVNHLIVKRVMMEDGTIVSDVPAEIKAQIDSEVCRFFDGERSHPGLWQLSTTWPNPPLWVKESRRLEEEFKIEQAKQDENRLFAIVKGLPAKVTNVVALSAILESANAL